MLNGDKRFLVRSYSKFFQVAIPLAGNQEMVDYLTRKAGLSSGTKLLPVWTSTDRNGTEWVSFRLRNDIGNGHTTYSDRRARRFRMTLRLHYGFEEVENLQAIPKWRRAWFKNPLL